MIVSFTISKIMNGVKSLLTEITSLALDLAIQQLFMRTKLTTTISCIFLEEKTQRIKNLMTFGSLVYDR